MLLEAVHQATHYFCTDTLGLTLQNGKSMGKHFYGASIPLTQNSKEEHFYLFFKADTLNEFGKILLFEDNLNEDDLDDLCKEVANQIIGHAKMTLETHHPDASFTLGTPEFLGHLSAPFPFKLEEFLLYKLKNRTFVIGRRTFP